MRRRQHALLSPLLLLLAGYLIARAALGAALNPPFNGPDESAHVEYVQSLAQHGLSGVTGVEKHQPVTYYALATAPWRLTEGQPLATRLFAVRVLSALFGAVSLFCAWFICIRIWPDKPLAAAIAALAMLAPGHLFILSSVTNDPLASALAALVTLAAVHVPGSQPVERARRGWTAWAIWLVACAGALTVKASTFPVVVGTGAGLALSYRSWWWPQTRVRLGLTAGLVLATLVNLALLLQHPTASTFATIAHFWPRALARAPVAYIERGGLVETFRTWWYGYDYLVDWPRSLETAAALLAVTLILIPVIGLTVSGARWRVPPVIWGAAAAQAAFVLARFGLGDVLQIEMGGAAQAKSLFIAIAPIGVLASAGTLSFAKRLRLYPRLATGSLLVAFLALDGLSLAVTVWHQYRWWQLSA